MASGNTLVNEIYDQFLVCKVCLEAYKNPKTLTCQHTFCRDCVAKHHESEQERGRGYRFQTRSISCPVCRKRTDLPVGGISKLSDNFLVSNLCEVVERRRTNKPRSTVTDCDICRPKQTVAGVRTRIASKDAQAHFRCLECDKLLCRRCADLHRRTKVTQDHGIFDIDVQERNIHCRVHNDETIRFYCEPCEVCICVLCTFQDHKDHEVYTFSEGIERHGHSLDTLLERSRGRCGRLRDQINLIGSCEAGIRAAEEYIRETAMDWVRQIRQQERQILRDLEELANEKAREFIQQKTALQETLEALESTCNLTEIVIRDRSVELLLLKDEINVKLNKLLAEGKIPPLPDIVTRRVAFVPGSCFLGRLDFLEPYAGDVSPHQLQSIKTKRTQRTNEDDLSSCVERSGKEESKPAAANKSNCSGDQRKTNLHLDEQPNLRNIPSVEAFTVGSKTCRIEGSKGKSKSVVRTSSTALPSSDVCQRNNRNSFVCSDRSITTTRLLDCHCDQVLDIEGLVRTRDSTTQSTGTEIKSTGTETDRVLQADKSMITNSPVYLDKSVMTKQACLRSTQTNTAGIVMLDMAVTAKIVGDHKATSTKPLVTVDQSTYTTPESTENATLSRLSSERCSDNSAESLAESSELYKHRAYLESNGLCNKKVSPVMREKATDMHFYQHMTDAFVQVAPEMRDSCMNTTLTAVDSVGCAEISLLIRDRSGINTSFLAAKGVTISGATVETVVKSTNTSMILPVFSEIGTNTPILEEANEGSCKRLPNTVEIGTNTAICEEKNEGPCQKLPTTEEIGTSTTVLEENNEGCCQRLPNTVAIGTNKPTLEEKSEVMFKNRPQTLYIQKTEHSMATAENGNELLNERSNWSTSLTFKSHSSAVETVDRASISKDFGGVANTGSLQVIGRDFSRRQTRVTLSRGTTTLSMTMAEKETGTDDLPTGKSCTVDRGCSPVRFTGIDKAVSASRGEIAEPVDKFQAPGKHTKLLQTVTAGPKLDAICEGSNESSSDEDQSRQMVLPSMQRQRPSVSWDDRKSGLLTHRERFAPSFGSKLQGRPTSSTFSVEGRRSACSILWKVEMGTNTSSVEFQDKATGTDSPTVDSKMAACINKLKTVSQRLEAKQTTSTSTTNSVNTSRESGELTTSSTSETMTLDRQSSAQAASSSPDQSEQPEKPKRNKTEFYSRVSKQRRTYTAGPDSSLSESSDQEQSSPAAAERRPAWRHGLTLARKKRFDVNDMLRSSSTSANKTRSPKIGRKPTP